MIQFLRGNKSQLETSQTIFGDGQPIFEKDTGQLKVGNGIDVFSSLPYVGASSSAKLSENNYRVLLEYGDYVELFLYGLSINDFYDSVGNKFSSSGGTVSRLSWTQLANGVYYLSHSATTGASFTMSLEDTLNNNSPFSISNVSWFNWEFESEESIIVTKNMYSTPPLVRISVGIHWLSGDATTPTSPGNLEFSIHASGFRIS